MAGQNIQLFLAEGTTKGLRIAEIKFRSERVTAASRTDVARQLDLPEVGKTGVYLLVGESEDPRRERRVYVGESDHVANRLRTHLNEAARNPDYKAWWEQTITITSIDANLTKAHALYLESALIRRAIAAGRAEVDNGQQSDRSESLSRADRSDMAVFLENIDTILEVLGVEVLRPRPHVQRGDGPDPSPVDATTTSDSDPVRAPASDRSPLFVLRARGQEVGRAQEIDGDFVVQAGATVRPWSGVHTSYQALQDDLVASTIIAPDQSGVLRLSEDHMFRSPSAASAVLLGRSSNGRIEWQRTDGLGTYAQWQDSVAGATATGG